MSHRAVPASLVSSTFVVAPCAAVASYCFSSTLGPSTTATSSNHPPRQSFSVGFLLYSGLWLVCRFHRFHFFNFFFPLYFWIGSLWGKNGSSFQFYQMIAFNLMKTCLLIQLLVIYLLFSVLAAMACPSCHRPNGSCHPGDDSLDQFTMVLDGRCSGCVVSSTIF